MKITILTLFPEMFEGPFDQSIIKRAQEKKVVEITYINIRNFGIGDHKMVDDTPYGGGIGMVLKVDVMHQAIEHAKTSFLTQSNNKEAKQLVLLTSASGKPYKQSHANKFSKFDHIIILCGHYEGVDERIINYIDEEISVGDFVLTGGEIPAMAIVDSVVRLLDGAITKGATEDESFSRPNQLLEYPHYTKPRSYEGNDVPEILLLGNHKKIEEWRQEKSLEKTKRVRPDLLKKTN
ncbi:MAG TPA: tRNA (guanosine(37)-N1)-methyltransferase TrmD [Candidatus Sulfotelmatobacter sp.]|jgi:tRNA (guanine37-N1)-methyltransferase|nr:tRNA (guanosine(37)-N1)-methyltransferase TrmD [Candidatus Sulfotelmatobacter sp.]